jgi:hypothetical protein
MAITHFTPSRVYTTTELPINPKAGASATVTTATTPVTLTVAQTLAGVLFVDCQDAGGIKFPTAANLVAGIQGCAVDTSVFLWVVNTGDTTLTPAVNTGGTLGTGSTAAQATLTSKLWFVRVTNVTAGSEAYTLWSLNAAALF